MSGGNSIGTLLQCVVKVEVKEGNVRKLCRLLKKRAGLMCVTKKEVAAYLWPRMIRTQIFRENDSQLLYHTSVFVFSGWSESAG